MFEKRTSGTQNPKELKEPENYHHEILLRLGKKFVDKDIQLSDETFIELGIHFIKILKQQPTEFSEELKATLYKAHSPNSKNEFSHRFSFESSKCMQNLIVDQIIDSMTSYTGKIGFEQLKMLLTVAEEINPTNIKNVNYFVAANIAKGNLNETVNLVIDKLNAANTASFNQDPSRNLANNNEI